MSWWPRRPFDLSWLLNLKAGSRGLLLALAGASLGLALTASPAAAHAFLVQTSPEAGERLGAAPSSIQLQFSEPVAGGERLTVKTLAGQQVPAGGVHLAHGDLVLEASLPKLSDGIYIVSWQALATDGHLSVGEFAFGVGGSGAVPEVVGGPVPIASWVQALGHLLLILGLTLAFGGLLSELLIWRAIAGAEGHRSGAAPIAFAVLLGFVGAAVQFGAIYAQAPSQSAAGSAWLAPLATRPVLLAAGELAALGYAAWLLPVRWARPWASLPLGAALLLAGLAGHPAASGHWWSEAANPIHLILVSFWFGALLHLTLMARRLGRDQLLTTLAAGLRRYMKLALAAVSIGLALGLVVALGQFTAPPQLLSTWYGRILLAKSLAVALGLGLALVTRRRLQKALLPAFLALISRGEAAALVVAVLLAGTLASVPPPRPAQASADLLGPTPIAGALHLAGLAGRLALYVTVGKGQLQVRAVGPSGDPVSGTRLDLSAQGPQGGIDIFPRSCGVGCVSTEFPWQPGTTTLEVAADAPKWGAGSSRFEISWPLDAADPQALEPIVQAMRIQTQVRFTEHVSSGPGASAQDDASMSGPQFISQELYAAGGAVDVQHLPAPPGQTRLTLFLPGSSIWYLLDADAQGRLLKETIVSPGHLIERTFTY